MREKIAFISTHDHHINRSLFKKFDEYFSDFEIDFIDIISEIKKRKLIIFVNTIMVVLQYSDELLLRRKKFVECFFRTSYIFNKTKKLIKEIILPGKYVFTFQTNSIFDAKPYDSLHFVYTDHTHLTNLTYPSFNRKRLFPNGWIEREKSIYQNSTKVFTYSQNVRNSVINDYGCSPDKVSCVNAGANLSTKDIIALNNDNYKNQNIIFVGIDWERKGGPELIEAFEEIQKEEPLAKLTIVGCSPNINVPNCNVIGRVKITELYKYYSEASIFCLPTKLEPFGIVFLEAMLNKLPVVATKIGAVPDFINNGKNGLMIEPGNVPQLKDALLTLLKSPEVCKEMGDSGYQHVKNNYTWDKVMENLKNEIEPLIQKQN